MSPRKDILPKLENLSTQKGNTINLKLWLNWRSVALPLNVSHDAWKGLRLIVIRLLVLELDILWKVADEPVVSDGEVAGGRLSRTQ